MLGSRMPWSHKAVEERELNISYTAVGNPAYPIEFQRIL